MRYVYIALILFLTAAVLLFNFQNIGSVTVHFLNMRLTLPLSILILLVYLLGMVTGGAVLALLRNWIHGATHPEEPSKS